MKNKIIALTLTIVLALSSASALAAERTNTNLNLFDFFNNYNMNYFATKNATPLKNEANNNMNTTNKVIENSNLANYTNTNTAKTTNNTKASNLSYEKKVVQLVNIEREKNGLQPLSLDSAISNVARTKSKDMADNNYFAHQSPTYGSAGDMLKQFGINWIAWGENIASGQDTPEEVVNAWMNSEGHRANILSSNFTKIGVGYVTNSNGTPYWTQMFAR
ncbi:MAG: CAP domain-containing protein [Tissierellia bacterium]|nr:CAP domain-containing protein [Tissierellia bacterium]